MGHHWIKSTQPCGRGGDNTGGVAIVLASVSGSSVPRTPCDLKRSATCPCGTTQNRQRMRTVVRAPATSGSGTAATSVTTHVYSNSKLERFFLIPYFFKRFFFRKPSLTIQHVSFRTLRKFESLADFDLFRKSSVNIISSENVHQIF